MPRTDRLQRQRKIDGYAVAAIAPVLALLPAWLIAVAAFWWVIAQLYYVPFAIFAMLADIAVKAFDAVNAPIAQLLVNA